MYRIIDSRGSGKTGRLMLLAKETGAIIACSNPSAMRHKAYAYGIAGLQFISYKELFTDNYADEKIMIDELESFVKYCVEAEVIGYTLSNED